MSPKVLDEQSLAAREQEIINSALEIIEELGAENLTMDKLVAQVPYSKGTVYSHFSSKEDILIGLNNCALIILSELFRKASKHEVATRERMYLMSFAYLIYTMLYPALFETMLCAQSPTIVGKASESKLEERDVLEAKLLASVYGLIAEAIELGDFKLPKGMNIQQICFTHWSTSYGVISLLSNRAPSKGKEGLMLEQELFNSNNLLLDGLQWTPFTHEADYKMTLKASLKTVFKDELQEMKKLGRTLTL